MANLDEQHEVDDRFPTGEWRGFFVQPDSTRRHMMNMALQFAEGRLSGTGEDWVGAFTISGRYDTRTGECSWRKQYVGQHSIEYGGRARNRGIVGQWRIPKLLPYGTGPFFIWPRALGDLGSEFERAFLEFELFAPLSNSPAGLVNA